MSPRLLPSLACLSCLTLAACGPDPDGAVVASAPEVGAFAIDGGFLYYTSLEQSEMLSEVWRVPVTGGDAELLHRSAERSTSSLAPFVVDVDGEHAWWLERCPQPEAGECQRLYRVPVTGARDAELVLEADIFDIEIDGDQLFFTTSDQRGTRNDVPGGVWVMPLAGGEPTALATGLIGLRDVVVHGDFVYTSDVVREGQETRLLRVPRTGGAPEILASFASDGGLRAFHYATDGESLVWATPSSVYRTTIGSGATALLLQLDHPIYGLALDPAGTVYVSDAGVTVGGNDDEAGEYIDGAVLSVPLAGGPSTVVAAHQHTAAEIVIDGGNLYWRSLGIDEDHTIRTLPVPPVP